MLLLDKLSFLYAASPWLPDVRPGKTPIPGVSQSHSSQSVWEQVSQMYSIVFTKTRKKEIRANQAK